MANGKHDLRLDLGMPDHPKIRRLVRLTGDRGFRCLIRLWCFAGKHHRTGVFDGFSPEDVEDAAGWSGKSSAFHAAMMTCKLLEDDGVTLHDWPEEQPWLFGSEERSVLARVLAMKRWDRVREGQLRIAEGNAARIAARNAKGNAPSPSPLPYPEEKKRSGEERGGSGSSQGAEPPRDTAGNVTEEHRARVVAALLGSDRAQEA